MTAVQTQLLDKVGLRLASMTEANGYGATVRSIRRATLKPFANEDLPAVNYWPGNDSIVQRGAGWVERQLAVNVEYYSRTRDRAFSDVAFELAQDIVIAVNRAAQVEEVPDGIEPPLGPGTNARPEPTLDGLARSIHLVNIVPQVGEGQAPWCGALVTFAVVYRVKAADPTTFV